MDAFAMEGEWQMEPAYNAGQTDEGKGLGGWRLEVGG